MNKTLQEQLVEKGLVQSAQRVKEKKGAMTRVKRSERLSEWELAELMGTNRPTYGRKKGGAYRQR